MSNNNHIIHACKTILARVLASRSRMAWLETFTQYSMSMYTVIIIISFLTGSEYPSNGTQLGSYPCFLNHNIWC